MCSGVISVTLLKKISQKNSVSVGVQQDRIVNNFWEILTNREKVRFLPGIDDFGHQ
tara:strand:- start:1333 stop:1500 length:168 start_codon:yes stop_codon:yes gene_type:complete